MEMSLTESHLFGLGSNIGDREANLQDAIERLAAADLNVLRVSPIYETEPVDYTDQRWFLNLVVEAETALFPMQLLSRIAQDRARAGRVRTVPKGPRTIDIDILFYGKAVVRTTRLEIPHPRMAERRGLCWLRWRTWRRNCGIRSRIRRSARCWRPLPPQVVRRLHGLMSVR